jgi:DNA-binding MarR family transcriptional regulator
MLHSNETGRSEGHAVAKREAASVATDDDMADALMTVSRALVGIAVRSVNAAPIEVTLVQHRLLVLLATGGDQTVGALADQLAVNASNASRLCDRLQRLGLVTRDRSSRDGRAVDVSLTTSGHHLLETVRAHRRQEIQQVLSRMPRTDVDLTISALTAFGEAAHEAVEGRWTAFAL